MSTKSTYKYLEARPDKRSRELTVKGTGIRASTLWHDRYVARRSPAQIARDRDIPIEAVYEALAYCQESWETIYSEKDIERQRLEAVALSDPVLQLSTPITRLAVMEGRTLAIATFNTKLDDEFEIETQDPAERAAIESGMREVEERIEGDMDPYQAAAQMDTDEIVTLGELRAWLVALAEMAYQATGYRRVKNPRIWSLHDLNALHGPRG